LTKQQPSDPGASMLGRYTHVVDRRLVKAVTRAAVVDDREHEAGSLVTHGQGLPTIWQVAEPSGESESAPSGFLGS
jgi:hypothetical protein